MTAGQYGRKAAITLTYGIRLWIPVELIEFSTQSYEQGMHPPPLRIS
jgi:hypothetical protein